MNSPRRVLPVALVTTLVVLSGCSDKADSASRAADRATTTTTTTIATTTTAAPDGAGAPANPGALAAQGTAARGKADPKQGPPTSSVAWQTPGEPSPLLLGTDQPEPEYPEGNNGKDNLIHDGNRYLLFVQIDDKGGFALADAVQLFVGASAKRTAVADGVMVETDDMVTNYYVRNRNPRLREIAFDPSVELTAEGSKTPVAQGQAKVTEALIARLGTAPGIPYRCKVQHGVIMSVEIPTVEDPTLGKK